MSKSTITDKNGLRSMYGSPSGRAEKKVLHTLEKHSINFIQRSPFIIVSTFDKQGNVDTSPKGGAPGFVKIINNNEIIIPDFKGNNRVDGLENIVETGRIGTLFLIPGMDETLRINGSANISTDSGYINLYQDERHLPKTCVVISVEEVFLHCAKALMRSKLWAEESKMERTELPTMGQMLNDQLGLGKSSETQSEMIKRYRKDI